MRRNLGRDQSRDRAARVRIEVETGSLTALEPEETGARDHRRVIRCQARARREHCNTLGLESRSHRRSKGAIARNPATQHQALTGKGTSPARSFLDERIDQRILESASDVCLVSVELL